jgi:pimeloyl-ACP methyl ester carboxylesterase
MITDLPWQFFLSKILPLTALLASSAMLGCSGRRSGEPSSPISSVPAAQSAEPETAGASFHEGQVQANSITIAYESFGPADRETMLLIQGQGAQLTAWPVELCEELVKRGYRVVIYDNRDVGLSTKFNSAGMPDLEAIIRARTAGKPAPMPYTLDDMAKDAVGLLDALNIKKAHIVGVSMGGMIAQLVAADYPEHTLSLTSIMAPSGNPATPFPAKPEVLAKLPVASEGDTEATIARGVQMIRILAGPAYPPDEMRMRQVILRSLKRSNDRAGMERHRAAAAVGFFEDRRPKLKSIKVPTIVIHGAEDPIVAVEGGKDVAANISSAELHIIPNMGHDLPIPLVKTIADDITRTASRAGLADGDR